MPGERETTIDRVRITAADFNGVSFDGNPFAPAPYPPWLNWAVISGAIKAHSRASTDYARWDVRTSDGVVDAGPGDEIVRADDGSLRVEVYRGR